MVARRRSEAERLSEKALIAATGISRRNLIRWRQQGLIPTIEPRRGLGRGRGSTSLEYPAVAVATINRINELRLEFKEVGEWRWRLWCEGYPVRIASNLADTLHEFRTLVSRIKTLHDIETKIPASLWKPANMPRGNPLRVIFRDLSDDDRRSLTTVIICVILGIRLPLFDEPNSHPFQIFKCAFGLPKEWRMPSGLLDVFPYMHEQIRNALSTASADELEGARAACRLLARLLDDPENSTRGAIVVGGAPLPWRPIKLASLIWPSPFMRAVTVGVAILITRGFKSALGEGAAAAMASIWSGVSIVFPETPE
jgi:hypothetical protein